ncbi:RNA polymerase sigma factor [Carboxylicivirga sp. RSCT41]|uniref:RNA polymerase sigma factor n=1 Tax=Carboxylicivirga agarovorans TaxID=3417570 RepID=UPI003D346E1D
MKKEDRFNTIILENDERIRRICRYHNSNQTDREDMYQEILVNIWKSLDNFKGESNINTWIYRIAVNTSLSYTGKSFKKMKFLIDGDTHNLNALIDEEAMEEKMDLEAKLEQLQLELNTLSVIDKALVSLLLEELSMKEISLIIGISESNVKVKIHRIKAQLKTQLIYSNDENR